MTDNGNTIRIGALMRAYAVKPEGVSTLINSMADTVEKLQKVGIHDIQIGVWADRDNPAADCGETYKRMLTKFCGCENIHLHKTVDGDLFVSVLNEGLERQYNRGLTHSFIMSWEAASYVDETLLGKMKQAISDGALAIGVALQEITEFICKGAIMNTLALWNIRELLELETHGFDPLDAKPRKTDHYAESNAGVGEFIPMLKLADKYGRPVLAVIRPTQQGKIEVLPERVELQRKKLESKQRRIDGMLREIGRTLEDLRATIMPGYPR